MSDLKVKQYLALSPKDALNPTPEAQQFVATHSPGNYELTPLPVALLTDAQRETMKSSIQVLQRYSTPVFQYEQTPEERERVRKEDEEKRHDFSREQIGIAFHVQATFTISHHRKPPCRRCGGTARPRRGGSTGAGRREAGCGPTLDSCSRYGRNHSSAIGKAHHLPVGAIVGLMHAPAASLPPLCEDINVYGETGPVLASHITELISGLEEDSDFADFRVTADSLLNPAGSSVHERLKSRLAAVAAIPDLAGLALCDAAVPGYRGQRFAWYETDFGLGFGYTVESRWLSFGGTVMTRSISIT